MYVVAATGSQTPGTWWTQTQTPAPATRSTATRQQLGHQVDGHQVDGRQQLGHQVDGHQAAAARITAAAAIDLAVNNCSSCD